MSQPLPTTHRIKSNFLDGKSPADVDKWEKWVNAAPTDASALLQLVYFQALQIRTVKLVLVWTLIILPILFFVGFLVANKVATDTIIGGN